MTLLYYILIYYTYAYTQTYSRLILQYFGDRFRFRLDIFVGIIVVTVIILITSGLLIAFEEKNKEFLTSCFMFQSMFTVFIVFIFLIIFSFTGAQTNDELDHHRGDLTAHIIKAERQRTTFLSKLQAGYCTKYYEAELERIDNRQKTLETYQNTVSEYNNLKPFTVVGIPARYAITSSVVSVSIAFFSLIYSVFTK